jgi:chloride channel 7
LVLLNGKTFMKEKVKTNGSFVLPRFGAFVFAKSGSGKGLKIEDLDFTDEEMEMYVDLRAITNTSPTRWLKQCHLQRLRCFSGH